MEENSTLNAQELIKILDDKLRDVEKLVQKIDAAEKKHDVEINELKKYDIRRIFVYFSKKSPLLSIAVIVGLALADSNRELLKGVAWAVLKINQ